MLAESAGGLIGRQAEPPRAVTRFVRMTEKPRRRRWPYIVGTVAVVIIVVAVAFRWDWLIPLIEPRASAALGRPVRIGHLHVTLGRTVRVVADDVTIGNPAGWPEPGPFATADHLTADINAEALIRTRSIELPLIQLDRPVVDAQQLADGKASWDLGGGGGGTSSGGSGPKLGTLVINAGEVHVRSARLSADFKVAVQTKTGTGANTDEIVANAQGSYAKQPITAAFVGGALLSLRDGADPYPIDLKVQNGPTSARIKGTVADPLAFQGAKVRLSLAGPDMSLLLPLTGIAIPKTPPYQVSGRLDYTSGLVKFDELVGKVGSSDLGGSLSVDTRPTRPVLTAALVSKRVDLKDLGGFIGAEPGSGAQEAKKPTRSDGKVLPDEPISLPRLNVADVHLKYTADRIEGQRQPLDNMTVAMDIVNGDVSLHPLSFGVGKGAITSQIQLREKEKALAMKADVDFRTVDVSKLLNATGVAEGAGSISGRAAIEGTGASLGAILGDANGEVKLYMGPGGNLSALLVDLSGLQFGNALLSTLGIPNRERIECLITDVTLRQGVAESRLTMLDTNDSRVGITGNANLKTEHLALTLRTQAKHFSVGSLPTPIGIDGTLGSPSIRPDVKEVGVRAAAAVGLGIFLTPIAGLLPTIQFGTGDDHACTGLLQEIKAPVRPSGKVAPAPRRRR